MSSLEGTVSKLVNITISSMLNVMLEIFPMEKDVCKSTAPAKQSSLVRTCYYTVRHECAIKSSCC